MKNLEQIRARNALAASQAGRIAGAQGGEVIKKIPALIINHGLLAPLAYAFEDKKDGYQTAFDHIAQHLSDPEVKVVPEGCDDHAKLAAFLTGPDADSETLKLATAEAMAWLSFARRFITKKDKSHR